MTIYFRLTDDTGEKGRITSRGCWGCFKRHVYGDHKRKLNALINNEKIEEENIEESLFEEPLRIPDNFYEPSLLK